MSDGGELALMPTEVPISYCKISMVGIGITYI